MHIDLLFDLDGTLCDPRTGIVRSFNHALRALGRPELPGDELEQFIGPPLEQAFETLLPGSDETVIAQAVTAFRERYVATGWKENMVYGGVHEVLQGLRGKGYTMAVCTAKRTDIATMILEHFQLSPYFAGVFGADLAATKSRLVTRLVENRLCTDYTWMIGDRCYDILAATENGLRSVGVLWGYGSADELEQCLPSLFARLPHDLKNIHFS